MNYQWAEGLLRARVQSACDGVRLTTQLAQMQKTEIGALS
jgi:hypothetical protein